jgi:signal transduction histidine kinase
MLNTSSSPNAEIKRLLALAAFNPDYAVLADSLQDLVMMAAKIAGTSISMVNLIDAYTQWSVTGVGFPSGQVPRDDSICQYTINSTDFFEVVDLNTDDRFRNKDYVQHEPNLKYYFGLPLTTDEGQNIGALCLLDQVSQKLNVDQIGLLTLVAKQIVCRIQSYKVIEDLQQQLAERIQLQTKLAHDIRGPISGIVGLARLYQHKVAVSSPEKIGEILDMIGNGGQSLLVLAGDILGMQQTGVQHPKDTLKHIFTLSSFKNLIEKLYRPMAVSKNLQFEVFTSGGELQLFEKNTLLQVTGNLVSNAMKFTPAGGLVRVDLAILNEPGAALQIKVKDSGVGLNTESILSIRDGNASSTIGTGGEPGFGFGLALVQHLVNSLDGTIGVFSQINEGTTFDVRIPRKNLPGYTNTTSAGDQTHTGGFPLAVAPASFQ